MRLVIDAQALQSRGSRHRGIGRYSQALLQEMALQAGQHEIILLLNGLYADTLKPIRESFEGIISSENIRIWRPPTRSGLLESSDAGRRQAGELIREMVIASLKPDAVLVMSLFEGIDESVITSVGRHAADVPTALILYDLIPYIYKDIYLENKLIEGWYENKLDDLRRAEMLLSISECTKRDVVARIRFDQGRVVNISGAASEDFRVKEFDRDVAEEAGARIGIQRPFIMYTGGADHRKNLKGLLHAFADLPETTKSTHQLVIVCFLDANYQNFLSAIMRERRLTDSDIVLAGRISDEDMIYLYSTCKVFIFPSIYEGFGLPALEAMQCGAPVIASRTSSLPEIVGNPEALFDPTSRSAITAAMQRVLEDEPFRLRLAAEGLERAQGFSWAQSAKVAWGAIHRMVEQQPRTSAVPAAIHRPRLAYVSPLPPMRSGIAGYSAGILPELSRFYDIDLIVDQDEVTDAWALGSGRIRSPEWLRQNHHNIDRVLYQFGNSTFHLYMFDLLRDIPGTVVLHDFGFGGLRGHLEQSGEQPSLWGETLEYSHGWSALHERTRSRDLYQISNKYAVNLDVIQQSNGVIVHSEFARDMSRKFFGDRVTDTFSVVPFPCHVLKLLERQDARAVLGWRHDEIVICCFGFIAESKLNHVLLEAWLTSSGLQGASRLIFVGEAKFEYGIDFIEKVADSGFSDRISITGWADDASYLAHLAGADLAVQLRGHSRGESSAAVFDCLTAGLPLILNAQGSFAEIPAEAVVQLPEAVSVEALRSAMERLVRDPAERRRVGEAGRQLVAATHTPALTALAYRDAVERNHDQSQRGAGGVLASLRRLPDFKASPEELDDLAQAIAVSFPTLAPLRRIWLDVATLRNLPREDLLSFLGHVMLDAPEGWKVEPIEQGSHGGWMRPHRLIEAALQVPTVAALVPEPNERDLVIVSPGTSHEMLQQLCEGGAQLTPWGGPSEPLPYPS